MDGDSNLGGLNDLLGIASNMKDVGIVKLCEPNNCNISSGNRVILLGCNLPLEFNISNEDIKELNKNDNIHILDFKSCGIENKVMIEINNKLVSLNKIDLWSFYNNKSRMDDIIESILNDMDYKKFGIYQLIKNVDILDGYKCRFLEIINDRLFLVIGYVPVDIDSNCCGSIIISRYDLNDKISINYYSIKDLESFRLDVLNILNGYE